MEMEKSRHSGNLTFSDAWPSCRTWSCHFPAWTLMFTFSSPTKTKTPPSPQLTQGLWADGLKTNAGAPLWPTRPGTGGLIPGYCSITGPFRREAPFMSLKGAEWRENSSMISPKSKYSIVIELFHTQEIWGRAIPFIHRNPVFISLKFISTWFTARMHQMAWTLYGIWSRAVWK